MDFDDQLQRYFGTPDLDIVFKDEADRDAARDFMDMIDRAGPE